MIHYGYTKEEALNKPTRNSWHSLEIWSNYS